MNGSILFLFLCLYMYVKQYPAFSFLLFLHGCTITLLASLSWCLFSIYFFSYGSCSKSLVSFSSFLSIFSCRSFPCFFSFLVQRCVAQFPYNSYIAKAQALAHCSCTYSVFYYCPALIFPTDAANQTQLASPAHRRSQVHGHRPSFSARPANVFGQ